MSCYGTISDIHVGDIGTAFRVTLTEDGVPVDISTATLINLILSKPDESIATKTAVLYTDGTDGIIEYRTVSGDLDQAGKWKAQVYVELFGWSGHSAAFSFRVIDNLV